MKSTFLLAMLAGAGCGFMLSSCNNSEELVQAKESEILKGIRVTLPDSPFAKETRTTHSIVSGAMHSDWQLGDTLGIYPIGGDQVAFPISDGEGTSTANFNGGAWALRSSYQYAAYYPFDRHNVFVSDNELAFDYTGQEQDGDGSLDHLGAYDFLAAGATETGEDGSVDLTLNHLGCFVRMQLTLPEANTLRYVRVASNNTPFIVKGTVDLSTETPSLASTQTSYYVELKLENVSVEAEETVTLYMMMAPVDLTSSILTFTVSGNGGASYSQILSAGKNMVAGKAYNYAVSLDKDDSQYVAVDLGLPSGLKWASFNVGATAPEEYGNYYAWGEVEPKENYRLDNYEHYHIETSTDAEGFEVIEYIWDDFGVENFYSSYGSTNFDICGTTYDVAKITWGGSWRMPNYWELEELIKKCTWKIVTKNGTEGCKITGPNGNWLFLPGSEYWTGTGSTYVPSDNILRASSLVITQSGPYFYENVVGLGRPRYNGLFVRPVTE